MATTDVETVGSGADKAKLAVAILLALGGFVAYFMLAPQGALAQWGGLIAGLVAGVVAFGVSDSGKRFIAFCKDSWKEVRKVVWPARREAIQMTAYVFAFVFVMALFLWLTDKTLEWLFYDIVLGWR